MGNNTTFEIFLLSNNSDEYAIDSTITRPKIGAAYFITAFFGILGNSLTAFLISTDSEMRNPTYFYMIQLCISDIITLIPIGLYTGLALIIYQLRNIALMKINAYIMAVGWAACLSIMTIIAYTRFIQLTSPHLMEIYFNKKTLIISVSLAWIIPTIIAVIISIVAPNMPLVLNAKYATWDLFQMENVAGLTCNIGISVFSGIGALLIIYFNTRSLICVHRMRVQIRSQAIDTNLKREIKLFVQIAINGIVTVVSIAMSAVFGHAHTNVGALRFIIYHFIWIFHHLHSPIVYFALNSQLRQRFRKLVC